MKLFNSVSDTLTWVLIIILCIGAVIFAAHPPKPASASAIKPSDQNIRSTTACVKGIVYFTNDSNGLSYVTTPVIDASDLRPIRC